MPRAWAREPERGWPLGPDGAGTDDLSVSRETLAGLAARYGLPSRTVDSCEALIAALAAERDPPTTLRTPAAVIDGHIADSLSGLLVRELATATRIADVGAGAGFPGLALAAALTSARVDLIESNARKAMVIERLARAAALTSATAVAARAEAWARADGAEAYDAVTARAVGPLALLVEYAAPLLRAHGAFVAWKGSRHAAEEAAGAAAAAQLGLRLDRVLAADPFEGARDRWLHVYVKVGPTPPPFPRRVGVAKRRPLA